MDDLIEFQGEPIIGATRMQGVAEAGEIVAAPHIGSSIELDRPRALPLGMVIRRERRTPKDNEDGLDVRVMRYLRRPVFGNDGSLVSWTAARGDVG
jgi:hypothetical protein